MGNTNELLIKINGDAADAQHAFEEIQKQTESLDKMLNTLGNTSALIFAALTAGVGFAVAQFKESKQINNELTLALQNQGIYSKELAQNYNELADEVKKTTGYDDDAVKSALAKTQSMIGQTTITRELVKATTDFAAATKQDLNSAFETVSRAINGNVRGLKAYSIEIADNLTKSQRMDKIIEALNQRYAGQAEAAEKAEGGIKGLKNALGDAAKTIGEKFAPLADGLIRIVRGIVDAFNDNSGLSTFISSFIGAAIAITGTIAVIAKGIVIFNTLSAAAATAGVAINVAFVGIPLAIGAVVAAGIALYKNWDTVSTFFIASLRYMGRAAMEFFGGLKEIIVGLATMDLDAFDKGGERIANAGKKAKESWDDAWKSNTQTAQTEGAKQTAEEQRILAEKKKAADEAAAWERTVENRQIAARAAERAARLSSLREESKEIVDLKTQEATLLKSIEEEKNGAIVQATMTRVNEIRNQLQQAQATELSERTEFLKAKNDAEIALREEGYAATAELTRAQQQELTDLVLTENELDRQAQFDKIQNNINVQNKILEDRKKFGTAYALINKAINSDEVQGTKSAAGELVQLQESKSAELKAIGKAAAVTSIAISTAESAMNIYKGFSTIPIVGPALGIAGAAAAIAFGAERTANVVAAASGGLIEGGIPGMDSVPAMLMPGEVVVPKKSWADLQTSMQTSGSDDETKQILSDIREKISQPVQQIVIQGDALGDDTWIDRLARRLSDGLEFNNLKIYGVNT